MRTYVVATTGSLLALLVAMAAFLPAAAAGSVPQIAEDATRSRVVATGSPDRVCQSRAQWIRLGFRDLTLHGSDTLTLTSSLGDQYTFSGDHWSGRRFHARALRGNCVEIEADFTDARSGYVLADYQFGTQALESTSVVVAGAGDICDSTPDDCGATSDLIVGINPSVVFTLGDNAYSNGTLSEFNTRYDPNWGRFKALTSPTPGNHEYQTSGASGYFDYFNGAGAQNGPAGDRTRGYYSFDVGDWHFVALNTRSGSTISSTQLAWLEQDLAANAKPCTAAYFHHPLVSRGNYTGYSSVKPLYDRLYAAKADLVLVGHDHNYQRYAKMTPSQTAASNGLLQVVVGTGGRDLYSTLGTHSLLRASQGHTWGVLKLTLTSGGYSGQFVPVAGRTWTDSFSGTCNKAAANAAPTANFSISTSGLTATFRNTSTDFDGTIVSSRWDFGDGTSSTATSPSHTYTALGTYSVKLTVTDDDGARRSITRDVPTLTLSGRLYRVSGKVRVDLAWTRARTSRVDVYRGSRRIARTTNDGTYTDSTSLTGTGGRLTYRVCEAYRSICSRTITLTY